MFCYKQETVDLVTDLLKKSLMENFLCSVICSGVWRRTITFQNNCFYLLQWTPFKNDDKCFSFRVKISFRSYQIFTFSSWFFGYVENALRKKLWLISKFITPNTGQQIIQYTYYPISQEVKATRQWNLFS